jgi:hypothetical protein
MLLYRWARIGLLIYLQTYPGYTLIERVIDIFEKRQRIRLIVTSDNYFELRICWGLVEFTKGSKREFIIEGGPGLCNSAMSSLEGAGKTVKIIGQTMGNRELAGK